MLDNISGFLKMDMVDWESKRIQFGSIPVAGLLVCVNMYAYCKSVVAGEAAGGVALAGAVGFVDVLPSDGQSLA
jgi:hypothetical protein